MNNQNLLGGGSWWLVDKPGNKIWYVQNNGADGDNWASNNVRTSGVGAIGWYVPYSAKIAQQLWDAESKLSGNHTGTLSDYHRYEVARILVTALEKLPAMVETIEPQQLAEWLAQSPPSFLNEPPAAQPWQSAGADNDLKMAWSRALMRVMDAAIQAPFNRELPALLDDARQAIAQETERQTQLFTQGQDLPPEALRIVQLHALNTASQLYAATLVQVHHESARMIQTYQDLNNQGKQAEADQCALDYQARQLGYAGVAHHFHEQAALHGRLLTEATSTVPVAAPPSSQQPHDSNAISPSY
ncbi:MAG: hypothetical protein HC808_20515 [Candidatus Competibacteraceae bacterium]|nr:hypothetical protein [Candidatus Competibacteraceae bacterium]